MPGELRREEEVVRSPLQRAHTTIHSQSYSPCHNYLAVCDNIGVISLFRWVPRPWVARVKHFGYLTFDHGILKMGSNHWLWYYCLGWVRWWNQKNCLVAGYTWQNPKLVVGTCIKNLQQGESVVQVCNRACLQQCHNAVFHRIFQKYSVKIIYALIDWVCPEFP